jgi:hypothetical protein
MICPLAGAVAAAQALPAAVISPLALSRIAAMAAMTPDCATGHILELRPAEIAGRVDLSHAYLAGPHGIGRLADLATGVAALAPLWPFLDACAALRLPLIWLEHDLDGAMAPPSLFFAPPAAEVAPAVRAALALLPVRPAQIDAVAATVARLAPGARLRQVGVMVPRVPCMVRLVLDAVPEGDLRGHLGAIGWPGDGAAVDQLVAHPAFAGASLRADLDVSDRLEPALGVELPMIGMAPDRIRATLGALAADGSITVQAASALAGLATPMRLRLSPQEFPAPGLAGGIELRLNHFKAQLDAQGGFSVKAYLSVVAPPRFPSQAPDAASAAET